MQSSFSIPMSRRDFMKLAGLSAVGVVIGGSVSKETKAEAGAAPPVTSVDFSEADLPVLYETDVCVVGGGAAGPAAAVTAAKKGAKVVLV